MTVQELDAAKAEEFGGRMVGLLNDAMLSLMISVGHRTKLLDTMGANGDLTSEELAGKAQLNERYVREWLNALTVGGIVEYNPSQKTYRLPPEHAASLTRAAGPGNLAAFAQFTSLMGNVEDGIVEAFRHGGGVPYAHFPKFQELMAEDSAQVHDAALLNGTLLLVDGITDRLRDGIDVCDIGCGQGHAINLMAKEFPNSRFTGWDFSSEGIEAARAESAAFGVTNTTFEVQDASKIKAKKAFDFITTFDAIHDQAKPDVVLKNISNAMRDDGVYLCVDIAGSSHVENNLDHPMAPMLYSVSTFHCMTVSLALDGAGLGTMWGQEVANEMLEAAGFTSIETKNLPEDIMNVYYVARKS
ncbi:MAG: methyltransferase domain-containing protein [Acidimicrobiales bacterium]|nr:methyltransferase domain-containing protein [Acidimicrobiales bacterium]